VRSTNIAGIHPAELMLDGMAIECLLKAARVKRGHKRAKVPSGDPPPVMLRRSITWGHLAYAMIRILSPPRLVHRRLVLQL
jgi:hypothetical protein